MLKVNETQKSCVVLLASFNGGSWISKQMDSIFEQKGVDVSLIVSDDSSSDLTVSIIQEIQWPEIKIIQHASSTGSAGQNFFSLFRNIDVSPYQFVSLSDQDDVWLPSKLEKAIYYLQESRASGYSSSVNAFWPDGKEKILHQSPNVTCADFLFEGAGQGCTFVLTADFFRKVQKFCIENEEVTKNFYYHDWLVYLLSRCWGEKWFFDDRPGMSYRQHSDNDTGARSGYSSFLRRINLIANGWYKGQIEVAIELSKICGDKNISVARVDGFMNSKKTLSQRLSFALFIGRFGRRKLMDRLVLAFSVLVGWI